MDNQKKSPNIIRLKSAQVKFDIVLNTEYKKTMKTIKPVVGIGKIPQGKEFRAWLKDRGYETDLWQGAECYIDGERTTEDMEAAECWSLLWNQFQADVNRR